MQLNCVFGGAISSSTQRWSDNTLVCLLPPSTNPGSVPVWFDGMAKEEDGTAPCIFTYKDETDRALMELALQVVGLKMTGKIEDARNVAMRIVGNPDSDTSGSTAQVDNAMQLANTVESTPDFRRLLVSRTRNNGDFERVLLEFLSVIDVPIDGPTESLSPSISYRSPSGQTLLHLATMAKFPALAKFLVSHNIDIDARDKNGCTALFVAALVQSTDCARVLVEAGAALDIVNALGKTPAEVAPNGFFDFALIDSGSENGRSYGHEDEEEAAWGDAEEEEEDNIRTKSMTWYRDGRKSTLRKRRSCHTLRNADSKLQPVSPVQPDEKIFEAGLPDEKQVASFMETFSRTLAQWQTPQGMIPNFPLLHLPAIPAWNALSQMPAVFPVFVPMPALSALWGERRAEGKRTDEDEKSVNTSPMIQEWRAFWEKWLTQSAMPPQQGENVTGAPAEQSEDVTDAPPAYSPRDSDPVVLSSKHVDDTPSASATTQDSEPDQSVIRISYDSLPIREQDVQTHAQRSAHKSSRKQHDRMLILFWIPILFIGVMWALFHFIRVAFHATRALLTLKAGIKSEHAMLLLDLLSQMVQGKVYSHEQMAERLRELDCTEEQVQDWKNDNRGDHTVHIVIVFEDLARFLWFSLRDLERYKKNPQESAELAANWDQMFAAVIEQGPERLEASGSN
ncbi:uncharacterized protein FIBRA_03993 [Fibroporia radiculosa]|uniref:Uncharacterized protein n=1 Tax=Fibroporia radiculosa TaxID=599839 RepID=J4I9X5_9APHY|nr:uncharacterized protein FIBRA_03993 [Fibroporia radiculosa]CCM01921.1 predicted protein [Fibroporia radiculosa]